MYIFHLEALQELVHIWVVFGNDGIKAAMPSFKDIAGARFFSESSLIHIPVMWRKQSLFPDSLDLLKVGKVGNNY